MSLLLLLVLLINMSSEHGSEYCHYSLSHTMSKSDGNLLLQVMANFFSRV